VCEMGGGLTYVGSDALIEAGDTPFLDRLVEGLEEGGDPALGGDEAGDHHLWL
jgi:hypothetical protein